MHRPAWDKRFTVDNCPTVHSTNPTSPYYFLSSQKGMPLYELKYRGVVPSSLIPKDQHEHILAASRDDCVLKLTHSGVTFLGKINRETGKYEQTGRFKKRYTGSKTCAVDMNGRVWLDSKELDSECKKPDDRGRQKKSVGSAPNTKLISEKSSKDRSELAAISQENSTTGNISEDYAENATKVAKKVRKKSYKIDKAKVRAKIMAYTNTQRGKQRLYFWTVGFPQHTPDDVCYQAFNTWLTALRQRKMLHEYLWIAERQMGDRLKVKKDPTHTIHFHIAIPHYMNVVRANAMMRGTLKGLAKKGLLPGLICNAKTKESYYLPSIARYNGVDIAKHRKTKKPINFAIKKGSRALAQYLTKYVTKNDAGQLNEVGELIAPGFTHLAWHNSRGFSALFTGVTCTLNEFIKSGFGHYMNRVRVFNMNFATFIPWLYGPPHAFLEHLFKLNSTIQNFMQDG
jgi:hypothetical protein